MNIRMIVFSTLALIVGGSVGAGAALLYAPQSGRTTRAMIRAKGIMLQDRVTEDMNLARLRIEGRLDNIAIGARHKVAEISDRLQDTVDALPVPVRVNGR
jgi:gas vesicle protein